MLRLVDCERPTYRQASGRRRERDRVCGARLRIEKMASRSEPQMTENYDPRRFLADKQAV